ncbi:MAG: two-component regulator propeller domain-containing protein [Candidatus Cryptobacteroides sp.]
MKSIFRSTCLALVIMLTSLTPLSALNRGRIKINTLSVGDGLPHTDVNAIVQDKNGFMWFATYGGLCRFDGHRIKVYSSNNSGLSRDRVISLCATSDSLVYIGTESGGLNLYDPKTDSISQVISDNAGSNTDDVVYDIFESRDGTIWVCSNNSLSKISTGQEDGKQMRGCWKTSSSSLPINAAIDVGRDSILIGTYNGIGMLSPQGYVCLSDKIIGVSCFARGEKILVGTYSGIYEMDDDCTFRQLIGDVSVRSMLLDSEGHLWAGTFEDGLIEYDTDYSRIRDFTPDPLKVNRIASAEISALCEDESGLLWIGTIGGGLNTMDLTGNNIECYTMSEGLSQNRVITFIEDNDGMLWISSHDGGIDLFDRNDASFTNLVINSRPSREFPVVSSFRIDENSNIWIGTWDNGIWTVGKEYIGKKSIKAEKMEGSRIASRSVFKMIPDRDGHIWISTNMGLMEYFPNTKEWREYNHDILNLSSLWSDFLTDVFPDPDTQLKTIWVGTRAGLNKIVFNEEGIPQIHRVTLGGEGDGNVSKFISVITRGSDGYLYIGTLGDGLYRMKSGRMDDSRPEFDHWTSADRTLVDNELESIIEDGKGNLWIGGYGICRFNPETGDTKYFLQKDNLQSNSFKIWASYRKADGSMVFGGPGGFNIFHPDSIRTDSHIPKTVIASVKVRNEETELSLNSGIALPNDRNSLTFEFAALNYKCPEANVYRYRLDGYENEWNTCTGKNPGCIYSNLRRGTYTLEVFGSNSDGVESLVPAVFRFTIKPHFLQSTVAIIIYVICGIILVLLIWKLSERIVRGRNERRIQEDKLHLFTDMAHEIKTPLSLIEAPVEELLGNPAIGPGTRNRLNTVSKGIQSLQSVVEQILDLRKYEDNMMKLSVSEVDLCRFLTESAELFVPLARTKQINFKTDISKTPQMVFIDKYKMERVVVNLLSNAFKFTPEGGTVILSCSGDDNQAWFTVEDNGVGMTEQDREHIFERFYQGSNQNDETRSGTGIGLSLSKYIVNHHKGQISVESRLNFGSKFKVTLQKGSSRFADSEINLDYRNSDDLSNYEPIDKFKDVVRTEQEAKDVTILVVDDNDQLRKYLYELLSTEYNVLTADNGMRAYEIAIAEQPDLILSDIVMPQMSGIELCRRIKENESTSHILVVLLTARDLVSSEIDSWKTGADGFITKPFHIGVLLSRIENLICSRDKMRKLFNSTVEVNPSQVTVVTSEERLVKKCLDAIEANIDDPDFGVEELSAAVGISRAQLYRKISSITGLSTIQFIRSIRLKRAAQILSQDDSSVSDVMYAVGFNSLSYFSKLFKEEFGCMPKEYAKQKVNENKKS